MCPFLLAERADLMERSQVDRAPVVLTTTPLAASATAYYPSKSGEVRTASTMLVAYVSALAWSDVSGTLTLEESDNDGTTWVTTGSALTVSASDVAPFPLTALTKKAWRWKYVNDGTIQAKFALLEDRMPASANVNVTGSDTSGAKTAVAPTHAQLTGGQYNTTPPVLTNGQMGETQMDVKGNILVGIAGNNGNQAVLLSSASDAQAWYTALSTMAQNMGFNGSTWDRLRTASSTGAANAGVGNLAVSPHLFGGGTTHTPMTAVSNAADAITGPGVQAIGNYTFNGTTWDRLRSGSAGSDSISPATVGNLNVLAQALIFDGNGGVFTRQRAATGDGFAGTANAGVVPYGYNGSSLDRWRNNTSGTLLASAARTVETASANLVNYNARGIIVWLKVTAASGTGGLTVRIGGIDPISTGGTFLNAAPTAIIATGIYGYEIYPGASTAGSAGNALINQRTAAALSRTIYALVQVGDASSYTYSLGYDLVV